MNPRFQTLPVPALVAGLLALLALVALPLPARAGKPKSPAEAKALYLQKCSPCHGKEGKAVPLFDKIKIPSFADAEWQASHTDAEIRERITKGKPGTPMRAFGEELKPEEIEALLRHIRSLAPPKG